jgi:hypothetical protein
MGTPLFQKDMAGILLTQGDNRFPYPICGGIAQWASLEAGYGGSGDEAHILKPPPHFPLCRQLGDYG